MRTARIVCFFTTMILMTSGCVKEKVLSPPEEKPNRTLVFMTDFGAGSDVVVRITGKVRSEFPDVSVEYIPARAFQFREAAYILEVAAQSYPDGTYFTGIVEPGGTGTRMVFEAEGRKKFLLPDNGLASRIIHSMKIDTIYKVENPSVLGGQDADSLTFEELFTQATLSMLADRPLSDFGDVLADPVVWSVQDPIQAGDTVQGEILFTDDFGNCITNIPDSLMSGFSQNDLLLISTESDSFLTTFGFAYSSVPVGENVAFINSSSRLELAVDYGNLSDRYGIGAGTPVRIRPGVARIGILRYNDSATSESITQTMKSRLSELGFDETKNVVFVEKNALGNADALPGLVDEFTTAGIDILISVSTPASQAAVQNAPETIPIVFTYVTDPSSAGILDKRLHVAGLSDGINYTQYLEFVIRLFPALDTAGRIYSENEANAQYAQNQFVSLAPSFGIDFRTAPVTSVDEVPDAYLQIRDQGIKAILITDDNTMSLAMTTLVNLALADTIPVIGNAIDHVRDGALASVSVNNDDMAKKTGEIAVAVLRGVDPDSYSVQRFDTDVIAVNTRTASLLNYAIPGDVLTEATYIFP